MSKAAWAGLLFMAFSSSALAKTFETSYLQVQVPDSWTCTQVDADWACRPTEEKVIHSASLVFTAKEIAPEESLESLESQLSASKTITSANGRSPVTSQLRWKRTVRLENQPWVEALHSNRELEGYHSYYLATVTPRLVILLNLSFQQEQSASYQPVLEEIRRSVKLKSMALAPAPAHPQVAPSATPAPTPTAATPGTGKDYKIPNEFIYLGLCAAALLAYAASRLLTR